MRHVRQPVQFAAGVRTLAERGARVLLEVGPGTTLVGWPSRPRPTPRSRRSRHCGQGSDESLSGRRRPWVICGPRVWPIDWARYQEHAGGRRDQPSHLSVPARASLGGARAGHRPAPTARRDERDHPLLGHRLVEANASGVSVWEGTLDLATFPYLADHRVQGRVIVPATAYLEMVVAAAAEAFGRGR